MNAERLLAHYEKIADAPDAIARLRGLVLGLAVRGKLVPQDPEDEPALDLLKRIAKEKARLVKAGEFREPNNFVNIRREALPFQPAPHWGWARLIDIARPSYGFAFASSKFNSAKRGMPLIRIRDISGTDAEAYFDGDYDPTYLVKAGDYLVGMDGDFNLRRWRGVDGLLNQRVMRINGWRCDVDPEFVKLPLQFVLDHLHRQSSLTTVKHLSAKQVNGIEIPLPPLAEQHRIVTKVDELMALCDQLEKSRTVREETRDRLTAASLARLNDPVPETFQTDARFALDALPSMTARPDQIKQLRRTILNLAVRGKLVPQYPSDEPAIKYLLRFPSLPSKTRKPVRPLDPADCGGELPSSWVWLPLGTIISGMDAGWSPQCENHSRSHIEEWGVLKTTAVQALSFDPIQHKLLPAKLKPRPQLQAEVGDILVTRAGPKNRVGISCVVDVPCPKLMISDKLIRFHALGELSARYIALTLNAGYTFEQVEAAKSGMAVMQMNISQDKLRAIPIPLPPLAEQNRIVSKVDELMALCDHLEASLTVADDTRRRLLEALLTEALAPADMRELEAAE